MNPVQGGITAPKGFSAAGVACGIKKRGKDCALIFSEYPAIVAGTLTTNTLKAPCVEWAQKVLSHGKARGIVANSGNANCCTGQQGKRDNEIMARLAAEKLGVKKSEILVASTGIIGRPLPMGKVRQGIVRAAGTLSRRGSLLAAEAIMTTDTRPKEMALRLSIAGRPVTIGGIAKGSGMVAPRMATMFAFLTTDARIEKSALRKAIRICVAESFNNISVDGEMSTNDMVLLLANGAARNAPIGGSGKNYTAFLQGLRELCRTLAHEIVRDGEGVTRLMSVQVSGAKTEKEARQVARQVGNSLLVKTMVAGRDPNWGRVAACVGASGVAISGNKLTLRLGKITVFQKGEPAHPPHQKLLDAVDQPEVELGIDLGSGRASAQLHAGDLTEGYVRINAKYTT